jgi:hypothetical protein
MFSGNICGAKIKKEQLFFKPLISVPLCASSVSLRVIAGYYTEHVLREQIFAK